MITESYAWELVRNKRFQLIRKAKLRPEQRQHITKAAQTLHFKAPENVHTVEVFTYPDNAQHTERQCTNFKKHNHFTNMCENTHKTSRLEQRSGPMHEIQQTNAECWQDLEDESDRHRWRKYDVSVFDSIRTNIIMKLEPSCQNWIQK